MRRGLPPAKTQHEMKWVEEKSGAGTITPALLHSALSCSETPTTTRTAVKRHKEDKTTTKNIRLISTVLFFVTALQLLASCRGSGRMAAGKYTFSIVKSGKKPVPFVS